MNELSEIYWLLTWWCFGGKMKLEQQNKPLYFIFFIFVGFHGAPFRLSWSSDRKWWCCVQVNLSRRRETLKAHSCQLRLNWITAVSCKHTVLWRLPGFAFYRILISSADCRWRHKYQAFHSFLSLLIIELTDCSMSQLPPAATRGRQWVRDTLVKVVIAQSRNTVSKSTNISKSKVLII